VSTGDAGSRYIPKKVLRVAALLEDRLTLQAIATLTLPYRASRMALDTYFSEWANVIGRHNRLTIGWIKAYETEPQPHIHAVLVASGPLDCSHARQSWREIAAPRYPEAAFVEPYRFGIGGLGYGMKSLDRSSEQVQFSDNLSAFLPGGGTRFFGRTSAERRHIRRIALQREARG
jgi:hypothetical protein